MEANSAVPIPEEQLERVARMFFAIGEAGRLRILERLLTGEQCVGDASADLGISLPVLSQRLKILFSHGLLRRRRAGRHIYYALADDHVAGLIANALAHFTDAHERL
jgi:DNA-binding transcriptional ArsR family regulator